MKYYVVAELNIRRNDWVSAYADNVTRLVEAHGGRYLARTPVVEKLEGERPAPGVLTIVEWPSKAAADAFFQSGECRPYREARMAGASAEFVLAARDDICNRARMSDLAGDGTAKSCKPASAWRPND